VKGLILAGICLGCLVGGAAAALRGYRGDQEYKVLLGALAGAFLLYTALFAALPADLGFLPRGAVEPAASVDFWNGALVLALVFHGIWTFTYMAWTGPTIRVLRALARARDRGLTMREILGEFESGGQVNALLRRRLPKLVGGGYLREEGGVYTLLPRGRAAGGIAARVKRALGDLGPP